MPFAMSVTMPPPANQDVEKNDSDYDSNDDEDFQDLPNDDADLSSSSGSSEDEHEDPAAPKARKFKPKAQAATSRKRKAPPPTEEDLDSGDEATIRESKRLRKKRKGGDDVAAAGDEDSGGEGGLIKTRAQRRAEKIERQEYKRANNEGVTVDVNALWASLSSAPIGRRSLAPVKVLEDQTDGMNGELLDGTNKMDMDSMPIGTEQDDEMVTITRNYDFAGQKVTEEKRVHRDSAEAKLYFATQQQSGQENGIAAPTTHTTDSGVPLRRPLKRPSMYEPNPTGEVKGLPPHRQRLRTPSRADVLAAQKRQEEEQEKKAKAQRLNTVQKSAIDWAQHVDQEGLKDELKEYERSKGGYMAKMDFLKNVEGRRDHEERRARLAG